MYSKERMGLLRLITGQELDLLVILLLSVILQYYKLSLELYLESFFSVMVKVFSEFFFSSFKLLAECNFFMRLNIDPLAMGDS